MHLFFHIFVFFQYRIYGQREVCIFSYFWNDNNNNKIYGKNGNKSWLKCEIEIKLSEYCKVEMKQRIISFRFNSISIRLVNSFKTAENGDQSIGTNPFRINSIFDSPSETAVVVYSILSAFHSINFFLKEKNAHNISLSRN